MKNMIFISLIAFIFTSCGGLYITTGNSPVYQGQQQPVNQTHQCTATGSGQKCYFQVTISHGGATRLGQTVTFHYSGKYCYADITDDQWYQLQCGYNLTVMAYHY